MVSLSLSQDPQADRLLSREPLALLIGMVLDQQIPLERAFSGPLELKRRLGGRLDAAEIAAMDPERLAQIFAERPALHRFPAANAKRVQELCRLITERYGGRAEDIWLTAPDGPTLLARIKELPGFGEQKARIFVGLLGKQLEVTPPGWQEACEPFGRPGTFISVADITDAESLSKVRAYKAELKSRARGQQSPTDNR